MTGVQQPTDGQRPRLGPEEQAGRHRQRRQRPDDVEAGRRRARKVSNDLGGGTTAVADRVAANNGEANELAKATLDRMPTRSSRPTGVAFGNPEDQGRRQGEDRGRRQQFGGDLTVTSSTHVYRGATGYQTHFQISGRSSRTLLELMRPPQERDWATSLVVGVVTNNNDPDEIGRVRVKYPSLSDSEEPRGRGSRRQRGQRARPADAARRSTTRSSSASSTATRAARSCSARCSTARTSPADLLQNKDGSFALRLEREDPPCTPRRTSRSSPTRTWSSRSQGRDDTVKGDYTHETTGKGKIKAQQFTIEAGSSMTVKGVRSPSRPPASLTLKGATVDIEGTGPVKIKGAIINLG